MSKPVTLLQRLSSSIRNGDGTTLLLELIVVITGIFIGLQVDDWNENRKLREQQEIYMDQLREDLVAMRRDLLDKRERRDAARRRMISAAVALERCDATDTADEDLRFTLGNYQVLPPFGYQSATYDEMVASGALAGIRNAGLKRQIADTFSQLAATNANNRNFRISIPMIDAVVWRSIAIGVAPESGRPIARFDFESLCENTELRNAIVEMIDVQWDSLQGAIRGVQAIDNLLEMMAIAIGTD